MLYVAEGLVFGLLYHGEQAIYKAKKLCAENREQLWLNADSALKNGSLDEGLGFDILTGAVLRIEAIDTIDYEGRKYTNNSYSIATFGNVSDEQYWYAMAAFDKF